FQAEDGIRDRNVTGVQTCALPILGLTKGRYILLSAHREENIDTEKNFLSLFTAINKMAEKYDMPVLYSCHPRSRKRLESSGFQRSEERRVGKECRWQAVSQRYQKR